MVWKIKREIEREQRGQVRKKNKKNFPRLQKNKYKEKKKGNWC